MRVCLYVLCDYGSLQEWSGGLLGHAGKSWTGGHMLRMDALPVTGCRYERVAFCPDTAPL